MALANIAAYTILALSKLGLKVAENKKWLPSGYYHKKSVEQLKNGDIRRATNYNDTAIKKNPDSEKAQVIKELISMQRDSQLQAFQRQIENEEKNIQMLNQELSRNIKDFEKYHRKYNVKQNSAFLLFVPILYSFFYLFLFETKSTYFIWLLLLVSAINLVGFVILSRTILERNRITFFLYEQEFEMVKAGLNRQINSGRESLKILQQQYNDFKKEIGQREISQL